MSVENWIKNYSGLILPSRNLSTVHETGRWGPCGKNCCAPCEFCQDDATPEALEVELDGYIDGGGCTDCDPNLNTTWVVPQAVPPGFCIWNKSFQNVFCTNGSLSIRVEILASIIPNKYRIFARVVIVAGVFPLIGNRINNFDLDSITPPVVCVDWNDLSIPFLSTGGSGTAPCGVTTGYTLKITAI